MDDKDKIIIQQRLKERRLFLNMTYQDLADKTGLSKSTLQRYETGGINNLPIDNIYKLSDALGVSPNYFTDINYNEYNNTSFSTPRIARELYLKERDMFVNIAFQILAPYLLRNNYKLEEFSRGSIGDLVAKKNDEIWYFNFIILNLASQAETRMPNASIRHRLYQYYGRLAMHNKPISKYSFVVNDKRVFDSICKNPPVNIAIKISVILLDTDTYQFSEHEF